jgi:hypothetical protein
VSQRWVQTAIGSARRKGIAKSPRLTQLGQNILFYSVQLEANGNSAICNRASIK